MIEPLQQVLEQVEHLDANGQAIVAARLREILEELTDDQRWRELFADPRSPALLDRLADEALAEDAAGETEEGGWEL